VDRAIFDAEVKVPVSSPAARNRNSLSSGGVHADANNALLNAGDFTAEVSNVQFPSDGLSHRRTQAEPDETASDDEADDEAEASKRSAQTASVVFTEADSAL